MVILWTRSVNNPIPALLLTVILGSFSSVGMTLEDKALNTVPEKAPVNEVVIERSVNINLANTAEIASGLKGIGLKKAAAIIEWRNTNGQFTSLEQLLEVKGIGQKTLDMNKSFITI